MPTTKKYPFFQRAFFPIPFPMEMFISIQTTKVLNSNCYFHRKQILGQKNPSFISKALMVFDLSSLYLAVGRVVIDLLGYPIQIWEILLDMVFGLEIGVFQTMPIVPFYPIVVFL